MFNQLILKYLHTLNSQLARRTAFLGVPTYCQFEFNFSRFSNNFMNIIICARTAGYRVGKDVI